MKSAVVEQLQTKNYTPRMKVDFDKKAAEWDADPARAARAKAVAKGILRKIPLSQTMTGLEYGCGTGLLSFALMPHLGFITLADSSDGMLAVLRKKLKDQRIQTMKAVKLDLEKEDPPKERFSIIYTLMTLHHVVDIGRIMKSFYAVLEKGGWLCIADLDEEDGSFHGQDFEGHKGFNRMALKDLLEGCGFHDIEYQNVFLIEKEMEKEKREYPVFLMTTKK